MKRLNNTILALCFVLLAAAAWAQTAQTAPAPASSPKMEVQQPVFDAGTIYRSKDKIEHAFVIKNTGAVDLKILSARPG